MATAQHRRRSRSRIVLTLLAAALTAAGCADDPPPLERARGIVEDDGGFGTATEAGDSFAHAAELLLDAGHPETSAWLQVVAVEVLGCRQPDVYDARQTVLVHLDALERERAPSLPALPRC